MRVLECERKAKQPLFIFILVEGSHIIQQHVQIMVIASPSQGKSASGRRLEFGGWRICGSLNARGKLTAALYIRSRGSKTAVGTNINMLSIFARLLPLVKRKSQGLQET